MPEQFNNNTFASVYKDDFADSDNYHRILFNSGRYLQARELTQMQTIIQREMERFGRNIFNEGAAVLPVKNGFVDTNQRFVKLQGTPDLSDYIGGTLVGNTSSVEAEIVDFVAAEGSDPATLYVAYTNTSSGTSGETPITFTAGEGLNVTADGQASTTVTVQSINTTENPAFGYGTKASIGSGEFFVQGHFVFAEAQSIYVDKYGQNPRTDVGFQVLEDIVTSNDDPALFDNQGDVPNTASPGADRYRIRLVLSTREDAEAAGVPFVYVAKIDTVEGTEVEVIDSDGVIQLIDQAIKSIVVDINDGSGDYNRIMDVMATRTYEESGNYTVRPFIIKMEDHDSDNTKLILNHSSGVGYVKGYRSDILQGEIEIPKARSTEQILNEPVAANYGNYVIATAMTGIPAVNSGTPSNAQIAMDLLDAGGTARGSARVRYVQSVGSTYRIYLYDIQMDTGYSFGDMRKISENGGNFEATFDLQYGKAYLIDTANNNLFFPLANIRPSAISNIDNVVLQKYSNISATSGTATLPVPSGETFTDTASWIISYDSDGSIATSFSVSPSGNNAVISGLGSYTGNISVLWKSNTTISQRTKTLTNTTTTGPIDGDGVVVLNNVDIFRINEIRLTNASGTVITDKFTLDNGQRDNFYTIGRIKLSASETIASGTTIYIDYDYFAHSANGQFFSVDSYVENPALNFSYENIPNHYLRDGSLIKLRNVLDFRPTINTLGQLTENTNQYLPENTSIVTADITYYLPRNDMLILRANGGLEYVTGIPSFDPKFPDIPGDAMALYSVAMNAYTLSNRDVRIAYVENKRYTMRDIGRIEKRIDRLEEVVSLSLLDLDAANIEVLDSSGVNRTKSGFLTDNFKNFVASNVGGDEYRASLDITEGVMRPLFIEKNSGLVYDSDASLNTVIKADSIFKAYTDTLYLDQPQASDFENINPFNIVNHVGNITLSPSSDEWRDTITQELPIGGVDSTIVPTVNVEGIDDFTRNNLEQQLDSIFTNVLGQAGVRWREWNWGWWGTPAAVLDRFTPQTIWAQEENWIPFLEAQGVTATRDQIRALHVDRTLNVLQVNISNGEPGSRTSSTVTIPFIRSREVLFKAEGLMPNTKHFPFFDGTRVDAWCRQLSTGGFVPFSQRDRTLPDINNNLTAHPSGSTELVSNSVGTIEGSFFIPNNNSLRFSTGQREFALYDISREDRSVSTSWAATEYSATGVQETILERPPTPGEVTLSSFVRVRRVDPLAQTFFVDRPTGVYVSKVRIYFRSKGTNQPVQLQIRPVVNGYPSATEALRNSITFMYPDNVNVSNNATVGTDFVLPAPVYLEPETEYAIVLLSQSNKYNVWVASMGEFEIGTNGEPSTVSRITKQPSMGSLYKSQNGSVWEPSQLQDMKYQIFRADFTNQTAYAQFFNQDNERRLLVENPFITVSGQEDIRVIHPNHGLKNGDKIKFSGLDEAVSNIAFSKINDVEFTVKGYDETGYTFNVDSDGTNLVPNTDGRFGGDGVMVNENILMDTVIPSIETSMPNGTSTRMSGLFSYGHSLDPSVGVPLNAYTLEDQYTRLEPFKDYYFDSPRVITNELEEAQLLDSDGKSLKFRVELRSNSTALSPVIHANRASISAVSNLITNQTAGSSRVISVGGQGGFVPETNPSRGSNAAKYVTKPVTLAEGAVGLRVLIGANRPNGTFFDFYYKITNGDTPLSDIDWTYADPDVNVQTDENPEVFREYRYTLGGPGGTLPLFTTFQIKIVMRSQNSSKVPRFRDFRAIALGV
jgi:hypothetical protein